MNRQFLTIAKGLPPVTAGKTFFVSATTGADWEELNLNYPPDHYGDTLVHTSMNSALTLAVTNRGDVILRAPDFTTALTASEVLMAEEKGVAVLPSGKNYNGVWFVERVTTTLPATGHTTLFTVRGKVKLNSIRGTVTTDIQDQACNLTLYHSQTEGNSSATSLISTALCAATNFASEPVGVIVSITGTLANALVTSNAAAVYQAAPVMLRPGSIRIQTSATNTGSVKWRCEYEPLEPGALIFEA